MRFDAIAARARTLGSEFKNTTDPNDDVRAIAAFELREFQRRLTTGKEAAARPGPLLRDPVSLAVPAD